MKSKRNKLVILALILLIILLITGYTFSKLKQSHSGKVSFTPAKWLFNVTTNNGKPISNIVLTSSNDQPLAPGAEGSFELNLNATGSDVTIYYHTKVTNEHFPEGMRFYMADSSAIKTETIEELLTNRVSGVLPPYATQYNSYRICWEWPVNSTDTIVDSSYNNETYGFDFEIIGEQN